MAGEVQERREFRASEVSAKLGTIMGMVTDMAGDNKLLRQPLYPIWFDLAQLDCELTGTVVVTHVFPDGFNWHYQQ